MLYRRVPRLFDEIALARADGSYVSLLTRRAKANVSILDDLGLGSMTESQRHDLREVIEDRYGRASTVVTSQLPIAKWHEWIGDPTVADAVLDPHGVRVAVASGRPGTESDRGVTEIIRQ